MKKILWMSLGFVIALAFNYSQSFADDDSGLSGRMKKVEEQQEQIIQKLDEIKSELNVIKVRITSNQ